MKGIVTEAAVAVQPPQAAVAHVGLDRFEVSRFKVELRWITTSPSSPALNTPTVASTRDSRQPPPAPQWMDANDIQHVRGKPYHPQTRDKFERYHRKLRSVVKLENYWLPDDPERMLAAFATRSNLQPYQESQDNLTPQDLYVGRGRAIQERRKMLKVQTLRARGVLQSRAPGMEVDADHDGLVEEKCLLAAAGLCLNGTGDVHL